MIIDCDSPEVEKRLELLLEIVTAQGAFIHPALTLRCRNGELSLHSALTEADSSLVIKLPSASLPLVDSFGLKLKGSEISIGEVKDNVSREQQRIMELMVEIYNLSGKIASTRSQSPWTALASCPEVLHLLAGVRKGCRKTEKRKQFLEGGELDDLLLAVFIGSRTFKSKEPPGEVLMPFVDYINHHFLAPGFMSTGSHEGSGVSVRNAKPQNGSDELLVSYFPLMDSLDSWLYFGFIDEFSPVVKSVPVVLDTGAGTKIRVNALFGGAKEPPEMLRDIRPFVPVVIEKKERQLTVSRLVIPHTRAPFSLRRILGSLIKTLRPELSAAAISAQVIQAEAALIEANVAFYNKIAGLAASTGSCDDPALVAAGKLARIQSEKISAYVDRHKTTTSI